MTDRQTTDGAGLADVVRSVRVLARQSRELVEQAGCVAERELAMALSVTEDVRDRLVSKEALEKARSQALLRGLRHDAHRAVDIAFDAAATLYVFSVDLVEAFLDQPRPAVTPAKAAH